MFYKLTGNRGKSLKNSRSKMSRVHRQEKEEPDVLSMLNESMVKLEDPNFINDEIAIFQNRLPDSGQSKQGFCQMTREKSKKLKSTQGYRQLKNDAKQRSQKEENQKSPKLSNYSKQSTVNQSSSDKQNQCASSSQQKLNEIKKNQEIMN